MTSNRLAPKVLKTVFSKRTKLLQRTRAIRFLPHYILKNPIFPNALRKGGVIQSMFVSIFGSVHRIAIAFRLKLFFVFQRFVLSRKVEEDPP